MRIISAAILMFGIFWAADFKRVMASDPLTPEEKAAVQKQKEILDEIMNLYAEHALDRPTDFTACMREMMAMSLSKKCRDKFTHYSTPEIAKQERENFAGQFGGVGVELITADEQVIIKLSTAGGPAERAGLKDGDIILKVDGRHSANVNEMTSWIRGQPKTKVELIVWRPKTKQELKFTIVREMTVIQNVKWRVSITNPQIGIVEIHQFDQNVPLKFTEAVVALAEKKATSLVIDVRGNPGGLVDSTSVLLSLFSKEDDTLLTVRRRHEQTVTTLKNLSLSAGWLHLQAMMRLEQSLKIDSLLKINVVVLINGSSISASEIFAGTMKDYGYPLVGEKSYGKGVGQDLIELSDKSLLSLTTFEFLVGNHQVAIRDKGVTPTVEVKSAPPAPPIVQKEKMTVREKEQADPQLMKAIELLGFCLRTDFTPRYKCVRN